MKCLPCSDWLDSKTEEFHPPFRADWMILDNTINHTFTHFKLTLKVVKAHIETTPTEYQKNSLETYDPNSLPTLMKKILIMGISVT